MGIVDGYIRTYAIVRFEFVCFNNQWINFIFVNKQPLQSYFLPICYQ